MKLIGSELKLGPKAATESVEELSPTGKLNLPGLETVLKLRTQFGFKLNMGDKLAKYYDADYFSAAAGKSRLVGKFLSLNCRSRKAARNYPTDISVWSDR